MVVRAAKYAGLTWKGSRKVVALPHVKEAVKAKELRMQKKTEIDQQRMMYFTHPPSL